MVFLFGNNNNYSSQKQEMSDLSGKTITLQRGLELWRKANKKLSTLHKC